MPATYTTSQLRENLSDAMDTVAKGGYVDVVSYTTPIARLVPAGHDMAVLDRLKGDHADLLSDLATWTGIDDLPGLLDAEAELHERGVDLKYPEWDKLPDRTMTVDELVLLNRLASSAEAVLASSHPLEDWLKAIDELTEAIGEAYYELEIPTLTGLGAAHGYSPAGFVAKVKSLLDDGVKADHLPDVLGDDPLPADLVATTGYSLRETIERLEKNGVLREDSFTLLRAGIASDRIVGYARAGVTDPATIAALDSGGVQEYYLPRAAAEQLPIERWVDVLGPLGPLVGYADYRLSSPVGAKPRLFRLEELTSNGTVLPGRIAWDGHADWDLDAGMMRDCADSGIAPDQFSAVYLRISRYYSLRRGASASERDFALVERTLRLIAAGVDVALLDTLTLGATQKTRRNLHCTDDQLCELAVLRPTAAEAYHLRSGKRASDASTWIYQLELWRRFEPEATAFVEACRKDEDTADFTDWLASLPARELFYSVKNPARTEAVKVFSGKPPRGARISYLHATELAQHLGNVAYGRNVNAARADQAKRFQHAVAVFTKYIDDTLAQKELDAAAAPSITVTHELTEASQRAISA